MNEEVDFLPRLLSDRKEWVDASRKNNFEEGIQTLLTELYPDTAHFIFELLQNAEDAGASKIVFQLKKDMLTVIHNGKRLFDEKDVESITNIGKSTKKDDVNQIGKFGVGFKSVFSYTSTPRVHSGNFSFELRDLVCPYVIQKPSGLGQGTCFEFPFKHTKKNAEQAFSETADMLQSLKENVLLFLNNINEVEWQIEGQGKGFVTRLAHSENHIEIDHQSVAGERASSHWLRFSKPYREDAKLHIAIAFKLSFTSEAQVLFDDQKAISEQMIISPINGRLSIFFPAEKETTNLKFHIHGPYASTVARDSIPDKNEGNKKLLQKTGVLLAESLHDIKKLDLLSVDFLAVLPNDSDELTDFYKPLQAAVINEMKTSPLVPTHSKEFMSANDLYQGPAAIREIISDDDLKFLSDAANVKWAAGVMQNSRQEKFMKSLGIDEWGWSELAGAIEDKFYLADDQATISWLIQKKDIWMQKLYLLLKKGLDADEINSWELRHCKIIRLETEEHVDGGGVYFPDLTEKESKGTSVLPRVRREILKGRKEQIEKIKQFLEQMGVKEVGEKEEIEYILRAYYSENSKKTPSNNQHIAHINKFINWWEKHKENIFFIYKIFLTESGGYLCKPSSCYIDSPYEETGLKRFYLLVGDNKMHCLWLGYNAKKIRHLQEFAASIGAMVGLVIKDQQIPSNHPDKAMLLRYNQGSWSCYGKDEDYTIQSINMLLKNPSTEASYLIWRCICKADPKTQHARFRRNSKHPITSAPSSLVHILRQSSWIPDKKGNFHKPCDITIDKLHNNFIYDDRNGWLTAIGFGENQKKQTEEYKTSKTLLKRMGFDDEDCELIYKLKEVPPNERKQLLKEATTRTSFPEKESADPERRAVKLKEKIADAPEKEYEVRERSVRTTSNDIKPEVKIYLRSNYTNSDGEMICQICKEAMPFKLDDGSHYFEAVEFIKDFPKECRENYIALCPVCAAKFKHANGSKPEDIRFALLNDDNGNLSIPLTLAHEGKTIRFVQIHLDDIRAILEEK